MGKIIEYERTCTRDGTTWYVPEALTKKPKGADVFTRIAAAGEGATAVRRGGSSANSTRVAAKEITKANMINSYIEAQRCPTCGSQAYRERKVKVKVKGR